MKPELNSEDWIIRRAVLNDLDEMKLLFAETIRTICSSDYSPEQIEAWVSAAENKERWEKLIAEQDVFIVEIENQIAGFASLENSQYVDMFYVHKDYQNMGVGDRLMNILKELAVKNGVVLLTANVSKTALRFFKSKGFVIQNERLNNINGLEIINYEMFCDISLNN